MNLSFIPGDLHLSKDQDGNFVVTIAGQQILSTKSKRAATSKFHALRKELEDKFPARKPTPEERAELLRKEIGESLVGHNSLGGRKKKTTAGGTRTFGG
ncbi:MAG TPA: hypothetical protein VJR23_09435 [Candidatus Acidoferrales bacterium]|nr:hypothetical protein [Candidatus Acidoferrales bacterium]